jgi:protoporphyrinogen oxidase
VVEQGATVLLSAPVVRIAHDGGAARTVDAATAEGLKTLPCDHVISSMPLTGLVRAMDPPAPDAVLAAADDIRYRDFLTVALVIPEDAGFEDNWIYVHSDVQVGRIQNYGRWSPYMVKDGHTCLGLEYFVNEGDDLWVSEDDALIELATHELDVLGLVPPEQVQKGYVVRMPKTYPMYDEHYQDNVEVLRRWLEEHTPNVHPVGRNGMHRYNNQDHSMYTAMLTVENIFGAHHDIWSVNVEEEYHEEKSGDSSGRVGTGRDAPVIPREAYADQGARSGS